MKTSSSHSIRLGFLAGVSIAVSLCLGASAQATLDHPVPDAALAASAPPIQPIENPQHSSAPTTLLPDAPGTVNSSPTVAATSSGESPMPAARDRAVTTGVGLPMPMASHTQKLIEPAQDAPALTSGDKVRLGLRNAFSPASALGWFVVAGYEQVTDGSPNYGTDRGAFGRRLGDAAIRDSSEDILSTSVMAPILREDPRYYRLGPTHNFFARVIYAGTRPLITRTDSGRTTVNLALISGTLGADALTNLYYPQANRAAGQTMETFGGSMAGSALSDLVDEFYGDLKHRLRPNSH